MLKPTKILLVALMAGALAFSVASAQQGKTEGKTQGKTEGKTMKAMKGSMHKEGKQITLTGEVIDMYCYMKHPDTATGPDHAKCAKSCIEKGLPIGFLSNGQVYVITGKDHEPVASMVADYAGKQSKIKAVLMNHNGVKALELVSIEPAS